MDSMGMSTKMLNSQEYKDSYYNMRKALVSLKQQLKITVDLIEQNQALRSKGYEQYRTYCHNKRRDKVTSTPCNPVYSWLIGSLSNAIDKFFEWEEKHEQQEIEKEKRCI